MLRSRAKSKKRIDMSTLTKFFGAQGMTMTSAQHIKALCQELVDELKNKYRISFINEFATPLTANIGDKQTEKGMTEADLRNYVDGYDEIAKLNTLIAWLNEAVSAKDAQIKHCEETTIDEWLAANGISNPLSENFPWTYDWEYDVPYTEEDYMRDHYTVKDIAEYLFLQSSAAALGIPIHPDGSFSRAKKALEKEDDTTEIKDYRSSTVLFSRKASVPHETVKSVFFAAQKKHREMQKRYNQKKFEVENAVRAINDSRRAEHSNWCAQRDKFTAEKRAAYTELVEQFNSWQTAEIERLRNQKIIIPDAIRPTYEMVNKYGDDKSEKVTEN